MTKGNMHTLNFDYGNNTVAASCSGGDWEWNAARNEMLMPLEVFTLVRVEHQQHVATVEHLSATVDGVAARETG